MRAASRASLALLGLCAGLLADPGVRAEPLRVVMLPIVVHSAIDDADYVSAGLADMLASRLEQLGDLIVVRSEDDGTTILARALEAAEGAEAQYVIYGAFTQFGDGASLDVHCAPTRDAEEAAARRRIFIQSGNVSEIIPKLDELVDRVAFFLNRPTADAVAQTAQATGAAQPVSAADPAAGELDVLRNRLDALEQAVYGLGEEAAALPTDAASPES